LPSWSAVLTVVAMAASGNSTARAEEPLSTEALAAQATDPTASLMSFQLYNWYTPSFHGIDGSGNHVVFRTALPFELAGTRHIFRLTAPYVTSSPSGADGLTLDKWTAGPAFGFVNSSVKRMNWGVFAQTFFSYAGDDDAPDVGLVNIQPVLSYQLGRGRSLSVGNSAFVYDIENLRWSSLMLGVNYGFIVGWKGQKWRPNFEVDYDFKDDLGNQEWVLRAGVALLVPRT
jgi:hypothetical protein